MKVIDPYKDKIDSNCTPFCKFFRCQRKVLIFKRDSRLCGLTHDECIPQKCVYASCVINRYIANKGLCGLMIKRKTRDLVPDKLVELPIDKFKGKIRGDKDLLY